ncbi:MAG: META domain-containing protein, partial [Bacteroidota bacterium]
MKTALLSILVLTLISCDASTEEFVGSSWKVVKLKTNGTSVDVTNEVILKVNSQTEFSLKLDTNNCFGTYAITGKTSIKLAGIACTEMCCDSEFSQAVVTALYQVSNIKLKEDNATLYADEVEIIFERIDEATKSMTTPKNAQKTAATAEKVPTKTKFEVGRLENPNKTTDTEPQPTGIFIELYKSPCKGNCEEFYMK